MNPIDILFNNKLYEFFIMKSKLSELAQIKFLGKSSIVNKGDILFRRAGNIGETILVKSRKKIDKTQTFVLITADKKIVSPEYLFTVLSSCQSSFKRKSTGNTLKHITLEKLKNNPETTKKQIDDIKHEITYYKSLHENYFIGMNVFRTAKGGRSKINA